MQDRSPPGSRLVLLCIAVVLCDSTARTLYNTTFGLERLPSQLFELGITYAICWQLYRGRPWARWLAVVLTGLTVLVCAVAIVMMGTASTVGFLLGANLVALVILLFGPGVGHYFGPYGVRFRQEAQSKSDAQAELATRPLETKELPLVQHLLGKAGVQLDVATLRVSPMAEGGEGKLRFEARSLKPKLAATPAECKFTDSDGVQVSATLGLDQQGDPFELDIWKVDFSALEQWPSVDSFAE